ESAGAWGVLAWDVGDVPGVEDVLVTLRSAWREQHVADRIEGEGTPYPVAVASSLGNGPYYETLAGPLEGSIANLGGDTGVQRQIQQELQVNGSAWEDRIAFVGGAFGFWDEATENAGIDAYPGALLGTAPVGLAPALGYTATDNWDWAIYAQATADFTDWLSLTGGLRYTEEKKGLFRTLQQPFAIPPVNEPLPVDFDGSAIFSDWTPMASLALLAPAEWVDAMSLDHLMGYFTYAKGFRGGGWNGGARTSDPRTLEPFQPETMNSYEWGLKSIFYERISFNFAFFIEDRQDQQIPQIIDAQITPLLSLPDVIVSNAASSTARGFEIETQGQPLDGLLFDGSVGYLDGKYDDFPGTESAMTGEPLNRAGEQFTFLPRWQTHIGVQYSVELPSSLGQPRWLEGWVTPRLDWSYQSQTENWGPEITELVQPGFSLVNFRLSYDFNDDRSQFAFFANNLLDTEYFRDSLALGPRLSLTVLKYYEPPRWFGIEMSHRF
ncbi:MAG: TonB-dependent receptor, partial [Deltaproteobacteria bacterium]|nr:TonB-dependent receptor [Deltaproteobacteria bacterium]